VRKPVYRDNRMAPVNPRRLKRFGKARKLRILATKNDGGAVCNFGLMQAMRRQSGRKAVQIDGHIRSLWLCGLINPTVSPDDKIGQFAKVATGCPNRTPNAADGHYHPLRPESQPVLFAGVVA
jgi:hypothetical protein